MTALLVASTNGHVGFPAAQAILGAGGTALDAVEAAVRAVEDNPDDHTVGYGGYPNDAGEVELDASIMNGATRAAGAVGALRDHRHAITVARQVMERLPHVLLAGDGAAQFARELGMEPEDLLTPEAEEVWRRRRPPTDPEKVGGTVNVLALDENGHLASAVSTSGWAFKRPGRIGDSAIIGAGNYADDRHGAAACTGYGELAMRACTARAVVDALARGVALGDACRDALLDVLSLPEAAGSPMNIVAIDTSGNHVAASTESDRTYVWWRSGMATHEESARQYVTAR